MQLYASAFPTKQKPLLRMKLRGLLCPGRLHVQAVGTKERHLHVIKETFTFRVLLPGPGKTTKDKMTSLHKTNNQSKLFVRAKYLCRKVPHLGWKTQNKLGLKAVYLIKSNQLRLNSIYFDKCPSSVIKHLLDYMESNCEIAEFIFVGSRGTDRRAKGPT